MGLFDFLRPVRTPSSPRRSSSSSSRLLVVPVDDSHHSLHALEWTVTNLYRRDKDTLHLVSVVPRVAGPYPVEVLDADVPAPSSATVKAWRSEQHAHESETEALLSFMQHHAVNQGVRDVRVAALTATGGASGVGAAIAEYVLQADADMVVLGSRGLHGWQRHVQNLLGLGSVSYYTMLRVHCPVVVVKGPDGTSS